MMSCQANSVPAATYKIWKTAVSTGTLLASGSPSTNTGPFFYNITSADWYHADFYLCEATNLHGTDPIKALLAVQGRFFFIVFIYTSFIYCSLMFGCCCRTLILYI